jgi:hypothetical protein
MMRFGFMLALPFPQAMRSEGRVGRRVLSAVPEEGCSLQCQKKGALCSARRRVLSAVPAPEWAIYYLTERVNG